MFSNHEVASKRWYICRKCRRIYNSSEMRTDREGPEREDSKWAASLNPTSDTIAPQTNTLLQIRVQREDFSKPRF